ncbi:MAG: hypothetical protein U1F40_00605 [Turneriella sp.]
MRWYTKPTTYMMMKAGAQAVQPFKFSALGTCAASGEPSMPKPYCGHKHISMPAHYLVAGDRRDDDRELCCGGYLAWLDGQGEGGQH